MSFNTTFGGSVSDGYQAINEGAAPVVTDQVNKFDLTLAANTANTVVPVAFDASKLQYFWGLATGGGAVLKFNSAGTPTPSISLSAGIARRWLATSPDASPFSTNATTLYVDSTSGCRLYLWFGVNK